MTARFRRQLRHRGGDALAAFALIVLGLVSAFVIITQQKSAIPGWVPFLGKDFFHLDAEFQTAQSIIPGQGQAVTISGIRVGKISSVDLEDGHADVGLDVEPKYARLIHPDAHLLLRPKTNLNDMVVEVDPGTAPGEIAAGSDVPLAQTLPNVNPDQVLSTLDGDTRTYVQLLLQAGGEGVGGQGRRLSSDLRRLFPFTRDIARVNGAVAARRQALARVVHNFRLLAEELSNHDSEITRFVDSSATALGDLATRQTSIGSALRLLPSTLRETDDALTSADALSSQAGPALTKLIPQGQALTPALRATRRFFSDTTPTISDQLIPFAQQSGPPFKSLAQAAKPLRDTVRGFRDVLEPLNYGFNELAYDPPAATSESYLFYLPWLSHDLNATYLTQDAEGPLRRAMVMVSCNSTSLANGFANGRPFLKTLLQVTNIPTPGEVC